MLLFEDVIWASNTISNLCYCKHFKALLFFLIKFWTEYCNIISATNFVYVICICLIKYDLGCEVDLLRPFVVLNRLPGLYKWWYARVNMFNEDSHTWSCINWTVLSHDKQIILYAFNVKYILISCEYIIFSCFLLSCELLHSYRRSYMYTLHYSTLYICIYKRLNRQILRLTKSS
jgi:hypothetical protein